MASWVICPTFSSSVMRLRRSSTFCVGSRSGPGRLTLWKNSSLSTRSVCALIVIGVWRTKHSERLTAPRASTEFLIYFAVLRQGFRNRGILFYSGRLFNGDRTKPSVKEILGRLVRGFLRRGLWA